MQKHLHPGLDLAIPGGQSIVRRLDLPSLDPSNSKHKRHLKLPASAYRTSQHPRGAINNAIATPTPCPGPSQDRPGGCLKKHPWTTGYNNIEYTRCSPKPHPGSQAIDCFGAVHIHVTLVIVQSSLPQTDGAYYHWLAASDLVKHLATASSRTGDQ